MTTRPHGTPIRRALVTSLTALTVGVTLWAGGVPDSASGAAAGQDPTTTIDAGTNAQAAADALNAGCADTTKCTWKSDGQLTFDYGSERVIGDELYNCSDGDDGPNAETAVDVSDTRAESTSLSEKISLEVSLGFLGLEKASGEVDAFTKQAQTFQTDVKLSRAVVVPPGWKGYTTTQVGSVLLDGTAYVTQGINLIAVTGIDMEFPGFAEAGKSKPPAIYNGYKMPMTADEITQHCAVTNSGSLRAGAGATTPQQAKLKPHREGFKLTICQRPAKPGRAMRCETRKVNGRQRPPHSTKVTAYLERGGKKYAVEYDRRGGIRLVQKRTIKPGAYTLVIKEKPVRRTIRDHGRPLHRARINSITVVPLRIGWYLGQHL
ncbi:MAG TPA: hypothetical protein PLZ93_04140 [Nocardioides sp.]|uniref:hypothetical protein n=1 Tax=uncultured Nocardioides sp. TaxID=198441 RepID=UPI000EB944CB|nr:hypothetical protein [uncultured Nocardioides sp.]HCB06953.1 hypothetical protein [Nocardioides sp.]HRI94780.1 hypothetical protein [Nocardioides sp.]HRK45426.1 hypothetical protein [Nocardioides sp.]